MSRPRIFQKHKLPSGVVGIAVAVIADYERRAREIKKGALSEDLLSTYRRYNEIVDGALSQIEEGARRELLSDIIYGRGYNTSMIGWMYCKETYYLRKREVIYTVAKELGLAD